MPLQAHHRGLFKRQHSYPLVFTQESSHNTRHREPKARSGEAGGEEREFGRHECFWNDKFTKLPTSPTSNCCFLPIFNHQSNASPITHFTLGIRMFIQNQRSPCMILSASGGLLFITFVRKVMKIENKIILQNPVNPVKIKNGIRASLRFKKLTKYVH